MLEKKRNVIIYDKSKLDKILIKSKAYNYLKNNLKFSLIDVSKVGKILIKDLKKQSQLIFPIKN